jgi:hypothetical protein
MTISRWILRSTRNVLDKSCRENKNTLLCSTTFFRQSCHLWDNVEKRGEAKGRRWQYGGALRAGLVRLHVRKHTPAPVHQYLHSHTHQRARTHTHTHTHTRIEMCNTYCFSTATVVSWTRFSVTLYVHCLSCYLRHCCIQWPVWVIEGGVVFECWKC